MNEYPEELKDKEVKAVQGKRLLNGQPLAKPQVGIALSGGGIRSATQSLGAFQALQEKGLDKEADYLSTVSGGGYFGSFWGRCFIEGDTNLDMQDRKIKYLRNSGNYIAPAGTGDMLRAISQYLTNWFSIYAINCLFFLMIATFLRFIPYVRQIETFEGVSVSVYSIIPLVCLALIVVFSVVKLFISKSLTKLITYTFYVLLGSLFVALVDSIGFNMYRVFSMEQIGSFGALSSFIVYLFSVGKDWKSKLPDFLSSILKYTTVFVSVLVILGCLSAFSHYFAWGLAGCEGNIFEYSKEPLIILGSIVGGLFLINLFIGRMPNLLNKLSLHGVFHDRLVRGFLGAAVPERLAKGVMYSTEFKEDDIEEYRYKPHQSGGPVHIINMTLNETIDGRSDLYQLNRKGSNLAVIPSIGKSLGVRHHCLTNATKHNTVHSPIDIPNKDYQVWADKPTTSEDMTVGGYMAISAAAMSTGMGKETSLLSSMVNGLLGVRLGYWWDSGIHRNKSIFNAFSYFFVNQRLFLIELFARYRGTAKRHWHLSDGAHFENLGLYELIRRKLSFMISFDHSQDDDYNFISLADLTRTVRADFGAELRCLSKHELDGYVNAKIRHLFGTKKDIKNKNAYASLIEVTYRDGSIGHILYIVPNIIGDEPTDVYSYKLENKDFPQQTTLDQFFDEEQWESYRRLMNYIVQELFKHDGIDTPTGWLTEGKVEAK